jgi:hypothetical protein
VHEGLRALADAFGLGNPFLDSDAVTRLLIIACAALTLTGSTLPAWGSRMGIPDALDWLERYRIYWRLYGLWHDLYRVDPDIALFPPRSLVRDALTLRDLRFRLYRRMVEIRDGILVLRRFIDPWVMERARELGREAYLPEDEIEALVAAASIAAALQTRPRNGIAEVDPSLLPAWGGDDVPSEAAALALVARFYRRSPIVRTILKQLKERDPSGPPSVEMPERTR